MDGSPTFAPTTIKKNEYLPMILTEYRITKHNNVVGLPLRSVLDFLLEIEAIGVANAR